MREGIRDQRLAWMTGGVIIGLAIALYWPAEPAYAIAVDRAERFAMCAVPTQAGTSEALFVMDFVTGRLVGAAYNSQSGAFTEFYIKELAADFGVQAGAEVEYIIVPARTEFRAIAGAGTGRRGSPATGGIYVGELNSGKVILYGFMFQSAPRPGPPQPVIKVASFPFRESFGD